MLGVNFRLIEYYLYIDYERLVNLNKCSKNFGSIFLEGLYFEN